VDRVTEPVRGYCQCGCGRKTNVAPSTKPRYGWVKGQPLRFVHGHQNRRLGPDYVVDEATGCWVWIKTIKPDTGYGVLHVDNRIVYAHRHFYEQHVGPIPSGLVIDHPCRRRSCVNPAHLEPVTSGENVLRGEATSARNARKTHCKHGHPLSGDNLYAYKGKRHCRECQRKRDRAVEERRKAARIERAFADQAAREREQGSGGLRIVEGGSA
jgi:hypothetical protein